MILKLTSKAAIGVVLLEKLESLFNKAADFQDCWNTYLLHSHLRFYFSLGKILKKYKFSVNQVLLKNVKYNIHRGVFRTKSDIYDAAFLRIWLTACSH